AVPHELVHMTLPTPPRSPLVPYTTLFRSTGPGRRRNRGPGAPGSPPAATASDRSGDTGPDTDQDHRRAAHRPMRLLPVGCPVRRSEEHTSELQSRENLVCRLLLEKKKK